MKTLDEHSGNKAGISKESKDKKQWIKFAAVIVLYLLFLLWVKSWAGLIAVPFIYDAYITKKIRWTWWKQLKNKTARCVMSWVDAIVFALTAVYFVNIFAFQNYTIPTSSLEKSLLVGDYLFVSKISYGPRVPMTPLSMPLTQQKIPVLDCKSFIGWPHWDYRRVKGTGSIRLNDIVVFNYPSGDTVALNMPNADFYNTCYRLGELTCLQSHVNLPVMDSISFEQQQEVYSFLYGLGRKVISEDPDYYGRVVSYPVDQRANYVKRCVGLPGQTLQIKDRIIYLDGKANKEPDNVQYAYHVETTRPISKETRHELGISEEDACDPNETSTSYTLPLTRKAYEALKANTGLVKSIALAVQPAGDWIYPLNMHKDWTADNYGPVWIPKKGESIRLTYENYPVYERPIRIYEGNRLEIKDGKIHINGVQTDTYTFKMDYYWMMGDNRHNSADSRYWGFVPEDHIVGKPIVVWLSLDKDRGWFDGKIRWNRLFKLVDNIK